MRCDDEPLHLQMFLEAFTKSYQGKVEVLNFMSRSPNGQATQQAIH